MERPELALGARGARAGAPQPGARAGSATGGHVGITFAGSPRHTLGVEIEVGIVSEATGALVGAAPRVLAEVLPVPRGRFAPEAKKELFDSTLELTTGVCATTAQVRADLRRALALPSPARLTVVSFAPRRRVHIERGENAGADIEYVNAVRTITEPEAWVGGERTLDLGPAAQPGAGLAVIAQDPASGRVHALGRSDPS